MQQKKKIQRGTLELNLIISGSHLRFLWKILLCVAAVAKAVEPHGGLFVSMNIYRLQQQRPVMHRRPVQGVPCLGPCVACDRVTYTVCRAEVRQCYCYLLSPAESGHAEWALV